MPDLLICYKLLQISAFLTLRCYLLFACGSACLISFAPSMKGDIIVIFRKGINKMTSEHNILVVDDDAEIRDLLREYLSKYGYQVYVAANGEAMFKVLKSHQVGLIILDIMMPGQDGFELCQKLRTESAIPIIMLTAMEEEANTVVGLEMGADDYLTKPFLPRELLARMRAVLRRVSSKHPTEKNKKESFQFSGWTLDPAKRCLISPDHLETALSAAEYKLLLALVEHPQRILSRDQLLEWTVHRSAGPYDRSVDIQVSRLRQKLEVDPKNPELIKTVRGGGYFFAAEVKR